MTCIAGIEHGGRVWIGGDSAGVAGWDLTVRSDAKVFTKGPMIFGFAGSFRVGQLLRYKLAIPANHLDDDMEWLVGPFIDAVRQCIKDNGVGEVKDGADRTAGVFLVGYRGCLYSVQSDYQVGRSALPFDAMGCGDHLALGSLATSKGAPATRLKAALTAAEMFSAGVRGPFVVQSGGAA